MNKNLTSEEKLFSKINHDLRGSFVSILGYTGILSDPKEEVTENEVKEFVSRIDFRTKETFELLESFTNWLKLEKYNDSITTENINLTEIIVSIQALFHIELKRKMIDVSIGSDEVIIIEFDIQIINSLLKNIFSFITKSIKEKSELKIFPLTSEKQSSLQIEFASLLPEREILPLLNLAENKIEHTNVPNEILFSKKFTELSGGSFELNISEGNKIEILIDFP